MFDGAAPCHLLVRLASPTQAVAEKRRSAAAPAAVAPNTRRPQGSADAADVAARGTRASTIVAFINSICNRKVLNLEKELHDGREEVFEIFGSGDPQRVRTYYEKLTRVERRIANWGALNFGVIRAFLLVVFIVVLYIAIDLDDFTTGNTYSVAAYVWTFVTSAEFLPDLMESRASIRELTQRLRSEEL